MSTASPESVLNFYMHFLPALTPTTPISSCASRCLTVLLKDYSQLRLHSSRVRETHYLNAAIRGVWLSSVSKNGNAHCANRETPATISAGIFASLIGDLVLPRNGCVEDVDLGSVDSSPRLAGFLRANWSILVLMRNTPSSYPAAFHPQQMLRTSNCRRNCEICGGPRQRLSLCSHSRL